MMNEAGLRASRGVSIFGRVHCQAVLYIRLNKAPVQQRRLIARSLDEARTRERVYGHPSRCHVGQSDTGTRQSPLFLRPVFVSLPHGCVRSTRRIGGPPAVPSVSCVWSGPTLPPPAPCLGFQAVYVWALGGKFRLKLRIV